MVKNGDLIFLKKDNYSEEAHHLSHKIQYEVIHCRNNYITIYCWIKGYLTYAKNFIDFKKDRELKLNKLLEK